jgi:arylsulfatase A-like enzyme
MQYHTHSHPDQPWFLQVWFNAPHGPWELLRTGEQYYSDKYGKNHAYWAKYTCTTGDGRSEPLYTDKRWYYKTMVSAMDRSVGMLLDALDALGIAEHTLVVFTSDNGAEMGAGTGGVFREGKRSLLVRGHLVVVLCCSY